MVTYHNPLLSLQFKDRWFLDGSSSSVFGWGLGGRGLLGYLDNRGGS